MTSLVPASRFIYFPQISTLLIAAAILAGIGSGSAREVAPVARAAYRAPIAATAAYRAGARAAVGYGYGYGCGYVYPATTTVSPGPSLPAGCILTLPPGAAPVMVMGQSYFFANGNYYSAAIYGGMTVYMLANP